MPPEAKANPLACRVAMTAAMLAAIIAISNQSFWIDEANAGWKAIQPNFGAWWRTLKVEGGSDAQMPFYMAALWGWEKIVGHGEWALRALNLLWFLPSLYFFAGNRPGRWLAAGASAFVWYCLDEARPYGMQIGASLLLFGVGERMLTRSAPDRSIPPVELWLFALGLIVLAGSSLLGVIWAGAAVGIVALARSWPGRELRSPRFVLPAVLLVGVFAALGAYYAWNLKQGARASTIAGTDARNLAFAGYELLGLSGLGPGRTDLRAGGLLAFRPYLVPLSLLTLISGGVILTGARQFWCIVPRRTLFTCVVVLGGAAGLLLAAGYVKHFRVLGRHFTPLLPVVLAVQAVGLSTLARRRTGTILAAVFLVLSLTSAASIRFAPRHAKDDYRRAAAVANDARQNGKQVWWNADRAGAFFYGLPISTDATEHNAAWLLGSPIEGFAKTLPEPSLVITSKPDIYDGRGVLAAYLKEHGYQPITNFMAFTLWRKK